MSITKEDFHELLALQQCDTKIGQLNHRRENLPAHADMAQLQQEASALRPKVDAARSARNEMTARQSELEAEVDSIESRIATINSRLYDGSANLAPSDAMAMSQEVTHLKERRLGLEDRELEIMESLEPIESESKALEAAAQDLAVRVAGIQKAIADGQGEIDGELAEVSQQRSAVAAKVPAELMTHYDALRQRLGGDAVAGINGSSCGGCHLALSASEIAEIRKAPESEIIHCEECGRILVR